MIMEETQGLTPGHWRGLINQTLSDRSKHNRSKQNHSKHAGPQQTDLFQAKTTIVWQL